MKALSSLLFVLAIGSLSVACQGVDDPSDQNQDDEVTGEADQAIRDNRVLRTYYSNASHTTVVGTKLFDCTGTHSTGHTSAYFTDEDLGAC